MSKLKSFTALDILKDLNKDFGLEMTTLEAEKLDLKTDFLDTGSATVNAILSGSTEGGAAIGKITGFYGPSGCGKSFVIGRTIASAIEKGFIPIVIDTEGTWDARAEGFGIDVRKCIVYQEDVIEDIKNFMSKTITKYEEQLAGGEMKLMLILDSIGGLQCQKEVNDQENENNATDMGTRAKALRTLFKAVTTKCAKYKIPFIWSNHCYDNPAAFTPSAIQNMPGGKSPWYFSSAIVMMRRKEVKEDVEKAKESRNMFRNQGADIPIECVKQRFVRPFIKSETHISYDSGLSRYHGLFDMALALNVVSGGPRYIMTDRLNGQADNTKLGFKKNIVKDVKMWQDIILPVLEPKIQETFGFGNPDVTEMLDELYIDDTDE